MKARNDENLIDFSKYEVHEDGTIFSKYYNKKRYLKGYVEKKGGYLKVTLTCKDGKLRVFQWHRVIYYFFKGDIPEELQVNHIDEDKQNNALSNLNLLTITQNNNWGTRNERANKSQSITKTKHHVRQYDLVTKETIKVWFNAIEAAKALGFDFSNIYRCCEGKYFDYRDKKWYNINSYKGFGWEFV